MLESYQAGMIASRITDRGSGQGSMKKGTKDTERFDMDTYMEWDPNERLVVKREVTTGRIISKEGYTRGVSYSPEVAEAICILLEEGHTFKEISSMEGMPCYSTICRWRRVSEDFSKRIREAIQMRADLYHDKIHEQAESLNEYSSKEASASVNAKIGAYKWLAQVGSPERYAPTQKHSDPDGGPLKIVFDTGIRRPGDEGYEKIESMPGKIEEKEDE
jgi:hypothetical protein